MFRAIKKAAFIVSTSVVLAIYLGFVAMTAIGISISRMMSKS